MDPNKDVLIPEEEEKARLICGQVLGGPWESGPIQIKLLSGLKGVIGIFVSNSGGYFNKLMLCSVEEEALGLNNNALPTKALVRLVSGHNMFGILGEAGEAVCFYIFAENNMGPRLLGVAAKTRVEEYIPSRTLNLEDYKNPEVYAAMARKLAAIHCFDVPIKKDPMAIIKQLYEIIEKPRDKQIDLSQFNESDRSKFEALIVPLDLKAELDWIVSMAPKVRGRIVFGHNDFHTNNVLLRTDDLSLSIDQRLQVVDVEMCGYFYRGLDFGTHFQMAETDYADTARPVYVGPPSEAQKRFFLGEYLKEWRRLNPTTFDPKLDTEEHLLLEADFFLVIRGFHWLIFAKRNLDNKESILSIDFVIKMVQSLKETFDDIKRSMPSRIKNLHSS